MVVAPKKTTAEAVVSNSLLERLARSGNLYGEFSAMNVVNAEKEK